MKRFINTGDGTISDVTMGLMWQQETFPEQMPWEIAINCCEILTLSGYKDWRLPTIQELFSLVDFNLFDPAIDPVFDCLSSHYWSSTTYANYTNDAWHVNFYSGSVSNYDKSSSYYVRAVRGGKKGE